MAKTSTNASKTNVVQSKAEFVQWMGPILEALRLLGNSGKPAEVTEKVAEICKVADSRIEEMTATGVPKFYNQVAWARQYLVWEGLLSSETRGVWALTEQGKATRLSPDGASELFRKWVRINADKRKGREPSEPPLVANDPTEQAPFQADEVQDEIEEQANLLSMLKRMTPEGFENFCKFLLRVYGFERVQVTPRGADDGIDGYGVLQINPFVSFKVIFQCKRYKGTVGREMIGDLRNAMIGRADKGIMITTGVFSESAKREASREGAPPIELIDGNQLVDMLKRENIGVKPRTVYDLDHDFFRPYLPEVPKL